jgi:hypothetical protein
MKQGIKPMFFTHLKRGGRFLWEKGMHFKKKLVHIFSKNLNLFNKDINPV